MPGVPMMASDDGVWSSDSSAVNTGWLYFPEEDIEHFLVDFKVKVK